MRTLLPFHMHVEMKLNIFASLITRAESLKRHLIIQWRWYQLLLHALLGGTLIHKLNSWIEICWKNILKCDILHSIDKAIRSILRYDIKISNEIYFSNIWLNHLNVVLNRFSRLEFIDLEFIVLSINKTILLHQKL